MLFRIRQFLSYVLPAVIRPARIVWNQVIGFVFLVLAASSIPSLVRGVREFDGDAESFFRVALTVVFVCLMGGFGISSFRRAHKISRS